MSAAGVTGYAQAMLKPDATSGGHATQVWMRLGTALALVPFTGHDTHCDLQGCCPQGVHQKYLAETLFMFSSSGRQKRLVDKHDGSRELSTHYPQVFVN
jgi:hypothetical protein